MIGVHNIAFENREKYNALLLDFEKLFRYPLGEDYFRIDHGKNYFKFFDNLGEPYFFIAMENDQILAVCVAVLRELNVSLQEKVWYLCDLKVHPQHHGRFIVQNILHYAYSTCLKISKKVYGVSMNSGISSFNRMEKFARRLPYLNITSHGNLDFYLLDMFEQGSKNFIEDHQNSFTCLAGVKDLVLESSNKILNLMHYSLSSSNPSIAKLDKQAKFMICCTPNSELSNTFQALNLSPMASANILANFTPTNWDFIKSCDI